MTTIQLLPIGTYNLQAIARIPSGADDQTKVINIQVFELDEYIIDHLFLLQL